MITGAGRTTPPCGRRGPRPAERKGPEHRRQPHPALPGPSRFTADR
ncbi:Uncharacterised protein [Amycolatopsis camponoti]|uniref:Uncharacterized protein n=1 Tax=Amycolatopsis camponoti TaxID=2606593 RepID=A0A6I8LM68_9PSEU|nr:Uncharacterised protein [Amycolatopsis camponoti]